MKPLPRIAPYSLKASMNNVPIATGVTITKNTRYEIGLETGAKLNVANNLIISSNSHKQYLKSELICQHTTYNMCIFVFQC